VSKSAQSLSRDAGPRARFPSARGWSKARAVSIPIVTSTSMTCAMGAVLPPLPGLVLFTLGMVIACLLVVGRMEPLVVRVVYGGARLTAEDHHALGPVLAVLSSHGLGPPPVRFWVRHGSPSDDPISVGRRSVLVSRGLITAISSGEVGVERAAMLLAQPAGPVRGGATRGDLFIRFWTLPWVFLTSGMVFAAGRFGVVPLVRVTWKARWLLTVVAAAQAMAESHLAQLSSSSASEPSPTSGRAGCARGRPNVRSSGTRQLQRSVPARREQGMLWGVKTRMDRKPVWSAGVPWPASVT